MPTFSVILPTYNERENLPIITEMLVSTLSNRYNNAHCSTEIDSYEILIIDDNSPDGTAEIAETLRTLYGDHIILLRRCGKLGLGSAYMYGVEHARGDFVIILDADLSHHPKYIPTMVAQQRHSGSDIVAGTRYSAGGGVCGWDFRRRLISRGANFLAQTLLSPSQHLSDLTSSFRLYKKSALEPLLRECTTRGYVFQMEILVRAASHNLKITQIPIVFVDRILGASKLSTSEISQYLYALLTLLFTLP